MIVINSTVALGDAIITFPHMKAILTQKNPPIYLVWGNRDIGDLFGAERFGGLRLEDIPFFTTQEVHNICLHDFILGRRAGHGEIADIFGITVDGSERVEPVYSSDPNIPTYDVVLAPYVLNNAQKNPPPAFWQAFVTHLTQERGFSVGVVGKSTPPEDRDLLKIEGGVEKFHAPGFLHANFTRYLEGVQYFTDEPLTKVATLMRKARLFVSPDTGLMHLHNLIGGPRMTVYPETIITTGGRRNEFGRLTTIEDAIGLIDEALT